MASLIAHTNSYFRPSAEALVPSEVEQCVALYECELAYSKCVWTLPEGFLSWEAFLVAVRRLDMTSSPGYPYMREATTNGQWLKHNGVECDHIQLLRLWHDVNLVWADEWDHVLRVFVKQEPHKKRKALENRWRLIMAAALPVQVCWQMLFGFLNDREIDEAYYIPSQQGLKMTGGGWKKYLDSWVAQGLTCGLDKSAWDWTAPFWAIMLDLRLRLRLGRGDGLGEWYEKAQLLYHRMFVDVKLILSDGTILRQVVPGVMKSGCVNTISINSHCQVFVHIIVARDQGLPVHPLPACVGDDTLQDVMHTQNLEVYRRYGVVVKSVSDAIEFVGHEFHHDGPRPMYIQKHFKKLRYVSEENLAQYLDSMARMYCHTEWYQFWEKLARALGYNLPLSQQAYQFWYDFAD